MAKRNKVAAPTAPAQAAPAPVVVTEVASVATKLTKRNSTPVSTMLVATAKPYSVRAQHNKDAWAAIVAALPANATTLAALPALANPSCISPQAFISYMVRRGFLVPQA